MNQPKKKRYIASVPVLGSCYTQGDTLEEAEINIKEATSLYLEIEDVDTEKGLLVKIIKDVDTSFK